MAFLNPTTPNLADFYTYVLNQGIPSADLPSGTLTSLTIDTSGNASAVSVTGTVAAGMALVGSGVPINTYIATWTGTSGTVSPAPASAVSAASATTYSPYLQWAFTSAVDTTLFPPADMPSIIYVLACYNLGMHQLIKIGQDQSGQTTFAGLRKQYSILGFSAGVITSSADQSTSQTLTTPEFAKNLLIGDLNLIKTPWGREYLDYAMQYGQNIVGVS